MRRAGGCSVAPHYTSVFSTGIHNMIIMYVVEVTPYKYRDIYTTAVQGAGRSYLMPAKT